MRVLFIFDGIEFALDSQTFRLFLESLCAGLVNQPIVFALNQQHWNMAFCHQCTGFPLRSVKIFWEQLVQKNFYRQGLTPRKAVRPANADESNHVG